MEDNEKYLVEFYYKLGRKNRRVFSFVSSNKKPAPDNLWIMINHGIEHEFPGISIILYSEVSVKITWLPEG